MAAPSVASVGTGTLANSTSLAINVPSGVASGDVIVVFFYIESDAAITAPDGSWTQKYLDEQNEASNAFRLYTFWKRATGADAGTYTFTWAGGASVFREGVALRITGATSSGDPFGTDAQGYVPTGSGASLLSTGILLATDSLALLAVGNFNFGGVSIGNPSGLGTWTSRHNPGASDLCVWSQEDAGGGGLFARGIAFTGGSGSTVRASRICSIIASTSTAYTAPAIVNVSEPVIVNSGTACNVTYPIGVAANDLLLCHLHGKNNLAWTVPTNWADIFTQQNNGTTQRAAAMWIRASGGETGTLNFAIGSSSTLVRSGFMLLVRNAITSGSPFDGAAVINADATVDDNVEWSDYDPGTANDLIAWFGYYADDATTPPATITGTPTGDLILEFETATGTDLTSAVYAGAHLGSHAAVGTRSAAFASTTDGNSVGVVFGILAKVTATSAPETDRGSAVMPVYRRALSASQAAPSLFQPVHQGAPVQQTTTTAIPYTPVRRISWQVSEPGQYHSAIPAAPETQHRASLMPPVRVAKPQPAPVNFAALNVVVAPADTSYTPTPGAPLPTPRGWQVYEPGAFHTAPRVPDIYTIPPERPRPMSRVQPAPWQAADTVAVVAAPQSLVLLGFTMPTPARAWQVYEPGAYHTAAVVAGPQSTTTQGTVLPVEPARGWQVIQAAQLHDFDDTLPIRVEAFRPPNVARLQADIAKRIETITAAPAPQTTVTQGTVMPGPRRADAQPDLPARVETITPPVAPQSTVLQGTVVPLQLLARQQDGVWKALESPVTVAFIPAPEARRLALLSRAQPMLWQAINGVPIPPTPGLPGHATTGHSGVAGTRDVVTHKPIWMRW